MPGRYSSKEVLVRAVPSLLCWKRKQTAAEEPRRLCLCFDSWNWHPAEHLWYSIFILSIGSTRKGLYSCFCLLTPPHLSAGLWKHLVLYPAVCIGPRPVTIAFIFLQSTEFGTNSAVALVLLDGLGTALRCLILAIRYSKGIKSFPFRSLSIQ